MDDEEYGIENEIMEKDILDKLYLLFGTIDETVIHSYKNKIYSYKSIRDDTNIFIMIDKETLQKILERIPKPKRIKIKTV